MQRRVIIGVAAIVLVATSGLLAYEFVFVQHGPCMTLGGTKPLKSSVQSTTFGAMTEYGLPSPSRWSNAITVAQDGSVWFGEQSVPGVGHLYRNGTLVEYPWPSAAQPSGSSCGFETSIWGVAIWNGMVWGTGGDQNALVGVDPQNGATKVLNFTGVATFPYTLAVAPDGSLWFTALSSTAILGRVSTSYAVSTYPVSGLGKEIPTQVEFANSSYAYFVALSPLNNSGGLYSFDPSAVTSAVTPHKLGGNFQLVSPTSVSSGLGSVWITQHGTASVVSLNLSSGEWTTFPTSTVNYTTSTLPYFISAGGGKVWFNEHYGNKIASIDPARGTMTEYSEADPPVTNGSAIGNDLTIARSPEGLWFTSTTGNYIGIVNSGYVPPFTLSAEGTNSASVQRGGQIGLRFSLSGNWKTSLSVKLSDSEYASSVPKLITMSPSAQLIPPGAGPRELQVQVSADGSLGPGRYTLAVTLTDGLAYQTAFVFLTVS